jgi:hypothetical protein
MFTFHNANIPRLEQTLKREREREREQTNNIESEIDKKYEEGKQAIGRLAETEREKKCK